MTTAEQFRSNLQAELIGCRAVWQYGRRNDDSMDAATLLALRRLALKELEQPEKKPVPQVVKRSGPSWPFAQISSYPIGLWHRPEMWR